MLLLALHAAAAPPPLDEVERPSIVWGATAARYEVAIPTDGPLTVTLEWDFSSPAPGWEELRLVGPELVVREVTGPVTSGPAGLFAVLPPGKATTVRVVGTLDRRGPGAATLEVLRAPRQRVAVDAPGLDVKVAGEMDGWLAAADTLALTWAPHADTTPRAAAPLVKASATTSVWGEPGALLSQTVARWQVLRGAVDRFELDVTGLEEVDVEGANLATARREGDRMVLTPRAPVRAGFEVRVRARRAAGDAEVAAPAPRPIASRVERFWTLGKAEDAELVPVGGPRSVPTRALPEWGRGLSDTAVVSAWEGDTPLRVRLARYEPLMGPDTVIERAVLVVSSAVEGRSLVRTTWHVRNERRQYLHVTPPPGTRPVTARVSGEAVLVLSDGAGGLYIPLEKSVETVQGLLTFPVELTWIAEGGAWDRKGERALQVPAVDAPIQAADWEVYLPRGVTSPRASVASAPPPEEEAGSEELQNAVEAYKRNDFKASNEWLSQARSAGSTSANVDRLQSNIDALFDADDTGGDDATTRRVRDLANARTLEQQVEQQKLEEEARRAYASGDVDKAEAYLEEVIALAEDIGVTEQKESAEQAGKKQAAEALLVEVKKQKATSVKGGVDLEAAERTRRTQELREAARFSRVESISRLKDIAASTDNPDLRREVEGRLYELEAMEQEESVAPPPPDPVDTLGWDEVVVVEDASVEPEPQEPGPDARDDVPEDRPMSGATTITKDYLEKIPAGRTYQSAVGTAAGVTRGGRRAAPKPAPKADEGGGLGASGTGLGGGGTSGGEGLAVAGDGESVDDDVSASNSAPGKVRYKQKTEIDFEGLDIQGELVKPQGALVLDRKKPAFSPLIQTRTGFDDEISGEADGVAGGLVADEAEAPARSEGKGFVFRENLLIVRDPAESPPPPPAAAEPPPRPVERRAALEVKAAPLTLAMPLGGEVVRASAALLPAGATPSLTVPYKTTGAPR